MILKELIETMVGPERIIVICGGEELYKGYVGCMEYHDLPLSRRVTECRLGTEIYKKEKHEERYRYWDRMRHGYGDPVTAEQINLFSFSDLELNIFFRVVLEE